MIRLEKVNKYYNKGKKNQIHVINNISLELGNSGLIALLGPSGCGKTTLLNVIGGLDKIKRGKIYINRERISKRRVNKIDKIRNLNIGYIFQDYKLIDTLSVFDNVAIVLKMIGIKDKQEIKKRVDYVLETLNIYRFRYRPASMLSGGERQRVAIARAIVKDPDIILADEPTGNLDSKNTIEIMNIIKSISKNRLVILVTHEVNLANFYADRIIELEDGQIKKDYKNENQNSLDYRIENNIYLKDLEYNETLKNIKLYKDSKNEKFDITIAVVNGNIYIESKDNHKIEIVDNNSGVKLINDNYKQINKEEIEKYEFSFKDIINNNIKKKYSSIYNIFNFIAYGFKKIMDYSLIKKILLLGYLASSMFIVFAVSRIFATNTIYDEDFVKYNSNYLIVKKKYFNYTDYENLNNVNDINYILLGDSKAKFMITYNTLLQNYEKYYDQISGSITSIDSISASNIISGRMPENKYEIIVDKIILEKLFNDEGTAKSAGLNDYTEIPGTKAIVNNLAPFTIVGVTDLNSPSIYVDKNIMLDIVYNGFDFDEKKYFSINNYDYELVRGKNPENDYEVLVNYDYRYSYSIGTKLDEKINKNKLKVVGYYKSTNEEMPILTTENTLKIHLLSDENEIEKLMIHTNNKEKTKEEIENLKYDVKDSYKYARDKFLEEKKNSMKSSIIFSGIILVISLIEIYLMIRSSFLSRIKEVGIYRAIGLKKKDIYTMFLGEILAITLTASLSGIFLMSYILFNVSKMKIIGHSVIINHQVIFISIIIVIVFNVIFGLIPVFRTMRKTPSEILSRNDI